MVGVISWSDVPAWRKRTSLLAHHHHPLSVVPTTAAAAHSISGFRGQGREEFSSDPLGLERFPAPMFVLKSILWGHSKGGQRRSAIRMRVTRLDYQKTQ